MDQTDKRIIELLREDSRQSYKHIAQDVHLSQPAVKERILKLIERNAITKFTIETPVHTDEVIAFIYIKTTNCQELENYVSQSVETLHCYRMAGTYNYCLEVHATDNLKLLAFQKSLRVFGPSQLHIITEKLR
ncbi:Lrp/AsnC family transcriptional regulator [Staphylococcus caeli]|uniref:Lrp/AsnC family transcriptional regulator n=1 Tax=Staphylococcus caeli TaxID=2201815 RepID=UPI003F55E971